MSGPNLKCSKCRKFKGDIVYDCQCHCDKCGKHIDVYPDVEFGCIDSSPDHYLKKGKHVCKRCRRK